MIVIMPLGGRLERVHAAVGCVRQLEWYENYIVLVDEADPKAALDILLAGGVPRERVVFDYSGWDTLTEFILRYDFLRKLGVTELWVVTDNYHMARAEAIAHAVFAFTDVRVRTFMRYTVNPHPASVESFYKVLRDASMAWSWRVTKWWQFPGLNLASRSLKRTRWAGMQKSADEARRL